jgi:hypothetical protein
VIAVRNPLFDGQLRRTIGHGTYGGAEFCECLATAGRVIDRRPPIISVGGYDGTAEESFFWNGAVLDPAQIGLFRDMLSRLPLPVGLKRQLPHGPRWLVMLLRALMARTARQPTAGWALRRGMLTHSEALIASGDRLQRISDRPPP